MICTKCGFNAPTNSNVCPNCGKPMLLKLTPLHQIQEEKKKVNEIIEEENIGVSDSVEEAVEEINEIATEFEDIPETVDIPKFEDVSENEEITESKEDSVSDDEIESDNHSSTFNNLTNEQKLKAQPEIAITDDKSDPGLEAIKEKYSDIPDYENIDINEDGYYDGVLPEIISGIQAENTKSVISVIGIVIATILVLYLYIKFIL